MTDIEKIEANTVALGGLVSSGPLCSINLAKSPDAEYSEAAAEPSTEAFLSYEKYPDEDRWVFEQYPRGGYAPYSVTFQTTAEMLVITQAFVDTGIFVMDGIQYIPKNLPPVAS